MILASISLAAALIGYAALCIGQPFKPNGKLRLGRRTTNALRRTYDHGNR